MRLCAVAVATVVVGLLIPELPLVPSILVRTGLMLVYLVIVWNFHIIPEEGRETFRGWIGNPKAALRAYLNR